MEIHVKAVEETVIRIDDEQKSKSRTMAEMNFKEGDKSKAEEQFDVIPGTHPDLISDHQYQFLPSSSSTLGRRPPQLSPETISLIMKEWNILSDKLPDSIFVRAYEGRIDLLRAVVIGPPGTPYQGGLFFYDICIPPEYPNTPPKLCFVYPIKLRLNPTLNPDMVVCCNEKSCTGKEKKKHSILDALLWQQANLITSQPKPALDHIYLLPTYWGYWLEREYLTFNQEVFMLNCQTMLATLSHPPRHFKRFVIQHFRAHAHSILIACKPYIDDNLSKVHENISSDEHGIQIGGGSAVSTPVAIEEESEGYRKSIKEIYVKLVKAFIKNGSPKSLEIDYNVGDIISDDINDEKKRFKATMNSFCCNMMWLLSMMGVLSIIYFGLVFGFSSIH